MPMPDWLRIIARLALYVGVRNFYSVFLAFIWEITKFEHQELERPPLNMHKQPFIYIFSDFSELSVQLSAL